MEYEGHFPYFKKPVSKFYPKPISVLKEPPSGFYPKQSESTVYSDTTLNMHFNIS